MIIRIGSSIATFKTIELTSGLNILLAERHATSGETRTRNSSGKSSLVDIISFLHGGRVTKDSVVSAKELSKAKFWADMVFGGHPLRVERSVANKDFVNIRFADGGSHGLEMEIDLLEGGQATVADWCDWLGRQMFKLRPGRDIRGKEVSPPSFRSLYGFFARRRQDGGFIRPHKSAEKQDDAQARAALSWVFGLDWTLVREFEGQKSERQDIAATQRRAKGSGTDNLRTVAALRSATAVAKAAADAARQRVADMRVVGQYGEKVADAARLKGELEDLAAEAAILKSSIRHVERSMEAEVLPDGRDVENLYADAGKQLPESVVRTPDGPDTYEYLRQKHDDDPVAIGSVLSDMVFERAWKEARGEFPGEFFNSKVSKDSFLKHLACQHMAQITPAIADIKDAAIQKELEALADIKPHAIITTNYDLFLEQVFDGYEPISGQTILRYNTNSFGEIFHIHGDVSDPTSIVLTKRDYDEWTEKKKYVSAKLLTYFAEHPVFIVGYGLNDPNVKAILRDIGELVADETGLIPNVYQIIWRPEAIEKHPPDQSIFAVEGREFRIRAIHTNDFDWIFKALKSQSALTSINPKLVRALAARTMKLTRHDIPSGSVQVDYDVLERVAGEKDFLPKLLGITVIDNPNQSHPYTLTQVSQRIGLPNWQAANHLLNRIKDEKGIDLRSSDNRYHCKIKTGIRHRA